MIQKSTTCLPNHSHTLLGMCLIAYYQIKVVVLKVLLQRWKHRRASSSIHVFSKHWLTVLVKLHETVEEWWAWGAAVPRVTQSLTQFDDWLTTTNWQNKVEPERLPIYLRKLTFQWGGQNFNNWKDKRFFRW